jgi:hypothetical protein
MQLSDRTSDPTNLSRQPASRVAEWGSHSWIAGPWFDLLFLANILWPIVVLLATAGEDFDGRHGVQFWQVYFVTTPHRWITLFFVFLDRDRRTGRPMTFVGLALLVVLGCSVTWMASGSLFCLLTLDYLWNAWHFAAQHHGIYRVYGRKAEPTRTEWLRLEKVSMRAFLLYVTVRVAGGTWSNPELEAWLLATDWMILAIPAALVAIDLLRPVASLGRTAYLLSVFSLYICLLWAAHSMQPRIVLALTTASALFHATEYLAIVSWSVRQRSDHHGTKLGWLHWFAGRWSLTLAAYIAILGIGGWMIEQHWLKFWLWLNVIVAFLHYAYDGLIWGRSRAGRKASG